MILIYSSRTLLCYQLWSLKLYSIYSFISQQLWYVKQSFLIFLLDHNKSTNFAVIICDFQKKNRSKSHEKIWFVCISKKILLKELKWNLCDSFWVSLYIETKEYQIGIFIHPFMKAFISINKKTNNSKRIKFHNQY